MRRDRLIILLQPYKNALMPKKELSDSVSRFARILLDLCAKYPRLRFNVALPGYILERIDPLALSRLGDMVKRGSIEWLCMGYTEPFLSFSPLWLTAENIALGARTFSELTGEAPYGFVPPFSNWEPSYIDILVGAGLKYAVVSNALLSEGVNRSAGYWITESTGSSMAVFPVRSYRYGNAPDDLTTWIKEAAPPDVAPDSAPRMLILRYMYSLEPLHPDTGASSGMGSRGNPRQPGRRRPKIPQGADDGSDYADNGLRDNAQRSWLERTAAEIDKRILELQPLRFGDVVGDAPPLGLRYFPSGLVPPGGGQVTPYFLNYLHSYDQISVMQRKLMEASDGVAEFGGSKLAARLKRGLFFAQDINRFLPQTGSGFSSMSDRLWTYGRLIDIEGELYEQRGARGGVIRLSNFLRNGYKSIVMTNRALKLYIDHKNGGQVYELDYIERPFSACAAYNPIVRQGPAVVDPRESRLAFRDKVLLGRPTYDDYRRGAAADRANFSCLPMEYAFKNAPAAVRILLTGNGGFTQDDGRQYPLTIDKVFGLEKDGAALSFSYKLGNPTPTDYSFVFSIEIPLALPGAATGSAKFAAGKQKFAVNTEAPITVDTVTEWKIYDGKAGVMIAFVTQKPVNIWIFPSDEPPAKVDAYAESTESTESTISTAANKPAVPTEKNTYSGRHPNAGTNGTTVMITIPTDIEKNSTQSFTGRVSFKKIMTLGGADDVM